MIFKFSETRGKLQWQLGGPTAKLSPWGVSTCRDLVHSRDVEMIAAYFAPTFGLMKRIAQRTLEAGEPVWFGCDVGQMLERDLGILDLERGAKLSGARFAVYWDLGAKLERALANGWQINSIISLYGAQPWGVMDAGTDSSLTGELNDRWDFTGKTGDFKSTRAGIPFIDPSTFPIDAQGHVTGGDARCLAAADAHGARDHLVAHGSMVG